MDIRVTFSNFAESGFAKDVLVREGITLEEFLDDRGIELDESSFRVSVNREPATRTQVLKDIDKVRLTPRKMPGA